MMASQLVHISAIQPTMAEGKHWSRVMSWLPWNPNDHNLLSGTRVQS